MASLTLIPTEGSDPKVSLEALGKNFELKPEVVDQLVKCQIKNFKEFRFFFGDGAQVETFITKLKLGDDRMIQTARLRRAWTAVCTYYQQAEQDRSRVQASDLDTLLDETELRDSKTAFWRRYRQRFPPEIHPADSTISRVSREMSKRMLCIFNVWKVKTLQHQLLTSQKKRKLGENLFTEEAEEEPTCEHTVEAYLDRLYTLLIAYAMAGVAAPKSSDPAFDAKHEATLGADSTLYALVPLDV